MILTFDAQEVFNLIEVSRNSNNRRATIRQSCSELYLRDGLDPEARNDMLDGTIAGDYDSAKIPEGVWLVGDRNGVYLTSNAPIGEVEAAGFNSVVYVHETNPETVMPDFLIDRAKTNSFGAEDKVYFIESESLEQAMYGDILSIDITPKTLSFLIDNRIRETCPETSAPSSF